MKEDINVKCALCGYPIHDTAECDNQLHATCNLVIKRDLNKRRGGIR